MRGMILGMISGSSLQAFSGAATTSPLSGGSAAAPIRLVRAQPEEAARQASPQALPETRPSLPPPRGSLLNLSV